MFSQKNKKQKRKKQLYDVPNKGKDFSVSLYLKKSNIGYDK